MTFCISLRVEWLGGSDDKESACNAGDLGSTPGSGRAAGGGMATHCSVLAWRMPWTEEPGGLQTTASQGAGHDWGTDMGRKLWFWWDSAVTAGMKILELQTAVSVTAWRPRWLATSLSLWLFVCQR